MSRRHACTAGFALLFLSVVACAPDDPSKGAAPAPPTAGAEPVLQAAALAACPALRTQDFAFTYLGAGNGDLYLYSAADQTVTRITDHDASDHWASWSPDGARLAFQTRRDGNREVYVMNADGSAAVNVTGHKEQDLLPTWSPVGSRIAFHSSRERPWAGEGPLAGDIFMTAPDGGQATRLAVPSLGTTSDLAWSRDASGIFYARFGNDIGGVYFFDLVHGEEQRLPFDATGLAGGQALAPDGRRLAYYRARDDGADLFIADLVSGDEKRLTDGTGHHYYAAWSADSKALLTTSSAEGSRFHLRCMAPDGSYDVAVIDGPGDARAGVWRPVKN